MPQVTPQHIYQKAVSVLAQHLEPVDLLFLHECMDEDEDFGLLDEVSRVVREMFPEESSWTKAAEDRKVSRS